MASASVRHRITVDGKTIDTNRTVTADGKVTKDPTLAAAKSGTLSTRTDNDTGVATMTSGHGITNGLVDVYWSGGSRAGMTATVATDDITIDGGVGDNLPAQGTALTLMVPQVEDFVVEYADLQVLTVSCVSPAQAVFLDSGASVVLRVAIDGSTDGYQWDADHPLSPSNPFGTTDVVSVRLSHGGTVARQVSAVALIN